MRLVNEPNMQTYGMFDFKVSGESISGYLYEYITQ
jgi:hypothetical protein